MLFNTLIFIVVLIALIIASYSDLKTREVPDWLNYSIIFTGIGLRTLYSAIYQDYTIILEGLIGLGVFVILAYAMFYAGQWGGGDSKLLMGLGAIIGLELSLNSFLVSMIINTFILGAIYGLIWSIVLAYRYRKNFIKVLKKMISVPTMIKLRKFVVGFSIVLFIAAIVVNDLLTRVTLLIILMMSLFTFYLWIFIRAVENSCMVKKVDPSELTIGDWIPKDIIVDGKRIAGPKDLGIEEYQIKKLIALKKKGKVKKVLMKIGIPFVPSFLMGFIATYYWGNIIFLFI